MNKEQDRQEGQIQMPVTTTALLIQGNKEHILLKDLQQLITGAAAMNQSAGIQTARESLRQFQEEAARGEKLQGLPGRQDLNRKQQDQDPVQRQENQKAHQAAGRAMTAAGLKDQEEGN